MADITPHGNLKSYMSHALDESSYLKALVKQLSTVTKDVDPEQGYATTLLNLNKRMLMSEKLLAKELGIKSDKMDHASKAVKVAAVDIQIYLPLLCKSKERYHNFL